MKEFAGINEWGNIIEDLDEREMQRLMQRKAQDAE